jgi:hypothetical protein
MSTALAGGRPSVFFDTDGYYLMGENLAQAIKTIPAVLKGDKSLLTTPVSDDDQIDVAIMGRPPDWLDLARACLDGSGSRTGVSAVAGLLLVRLLGQNAQVLRRDIARFWAGFRHGVAGWPPQVPKLWYS